ncbi:2TM domain-containing protein [Promethearchaeum syntrophicum]|uniref:2TM domain-containing protein n=1 Tax=Promethearchaeum syntrophicum TaxID=2594042 RepID=A0A5B9DG73_9ARCH|nr:2TM domain-containing protein [Candidatus Prometheoarchaeum syntrophicum]QEE18112.1 hypothetical protein DSAG12_03950 [Candidatus Prometheoarchaeum syntrophicum]
MVDNQRNSENNSNYSRFHGNNPNFNRVGARTGLRAHWITYIAVNCFLMVLNFLTGVSGGNFWFLYPLISWGIGISIHSSVIFIIHRYPYKSDRGFYIHFAVILTVSMFLFLLNVITGMGYPWFAWPVAAMGIGVGEHFVAYMRIKKIELGQPVARLHALWYPAVVCFFLIFVDIFSNGRPNWFWWPCVPIMLVSFVIIDSITRHQENLRTRYHERRERQNLNINVNSNPAFSQDIREEVVVERRINNTPSDKRYCPRCGEESSSNHEYCEYCGLKFE